MTWAGSIVFSRSFTQAYHVAPQALFYCDDPVVIGAPFYVMERLTGIILRRDAPTGLEIHPDAARRLSESFIDSLAVLHGLDYRAIGLGDLGKPQGYVERQVKGWIERYSRAQTDDLPEIEKIAPWLTEQIPSETGAALIHNDYKYDNAVLDPNEITRIVGVLDWEMCTVGDPLMDLGTTLSYWTEPDDNEDLQRIRMGPRRCPGLSAVSSWPNAGPKGRAPTSPTLLFTMRSDCSRPPSSVSKSTIGITKD